MATAAKLGILNIPPRRQQSNQCGCCSLAASMAAKGTDMSMSEAVRSVFSKYATFAGRAPRSEFWWWFLFVIIASLIAGIVDGIIFRPMMGYDGYGGGGPISGILGLALLLPGLAVGARRLHDIGRSGWWLLIGIIPLIGSLILLFWFVQPSQAGTNEHG